MSRRTDSDRHAIIAAGTALGVNVHDVVPVSLGRTGIYRVQVEAASRREGIPAGRTTQAARVNRRTDSITPTAEMHRLVHDLHAMGAPVAAARHPDVVATAFGDVGFWEWMAPGEVTARDWGRLTGAFHRAGAGIHHPRIYHPGAAFTSRIRRARELTQRRGHPLHGAHRLLASFEAALEAAVNDALRAAAVGEVVLVHGDNQPANVMRAPAGAVLNDFERIVVAPPAVDLAALVLGIQHYGYPPAAGEEFRDGYGPGAPTLAAAGPFARIRELSGVVVAMISAGDSPDMEHQMRVRAVSVTNPGQGEPWTYIGGCSNRLTWATDTSTPTPGPPGSEPGRRGRARHERSGG